MRGTVICGVHGDGDLVTAGFAASLAKRLQSRLVLVHVGESEGGSAVAALAAVEDAAPALVHVITPAIAAASAPVLAMPPDARMYEDAEQELRELAAAHGDRLHEPPRIEVRLGPVGHELTEAAMAAGHALLALGGSARRPMSAALAGEPARYAVRHGPCPVLVTPHDPVAGPD